jgi:peptidyl-prolyl cis-trans isomerase B (cyclophilin B)
VPSSRDQQLARARAVRRTQREKERERRKKIVAGVLVGVLVLAAAGVGIGVALSGGSSNNTVTAADPSASATPAPEATPTAAVPTAAALPASVACGGPKETLTPATRTFAKEPAITIDPKANYTMTLATSCGDIKVALDAAKAPHTVNLLSFLAADKFYNGSYCHRQTNTSGLTVLQCGDPTGTGAGSIGFTIKEENLTGATYPRGTLAMAKTSEANSTGSQFFLVDKDSQLPAEYTVAGHITGGLDVLDKLQAVGDNGSNGTGDGAPKQAIYLEDVTVTKS